MTYALSRNNLSRDQRLHELALAYRLFAAHGWGSLGDGHISARDPEYLDCFWMLRLGVSFDQATIADLVLVAPDGTLAFGEGEINISGYYIHKPIHDARPDIVSAAHVHTGWGTPFSSERRLMQPITQEACLFFENHALFDDEEVQVQDLACGSRIAAALGNNAAIILQSHGLLSTGSSVAESLALFVCFERVAEAHLKARDAIPVQPEAARYAQQDLIKDNAVADMFRWLVMRHLSEYDVGP